MTKLFTQVEFQKQDDLKRLKAENKDAYEKRKRILSLQDTIDEAFEVQAEIDKIEEASLASKRETLTALKQKIERGIEAEGIKNLQSKLGKATRVQAILKKLNTEGLYLKHGITAKDLATFTSEKLGNPSVRLYANK